MDIKKNTMIKTVTEIILENQLKSQFDDLDFTDEEIEKYINKPLLTGKLPNETPINRLKNIFKYEGSLDKWAESKIGKLPADSSRVNDWYEKRDELIRQNGTVVVGKYNVQLLHVSKPPNELIAHIFFIVEGDKKYIFYEGYLNSNKEMVARGYEIK